MADCEPIDPHAHNVEEDLKESEFVEGESAGKWEVVKYDFPILKFKVRATETDGAQSWYGFKADLTNFPAINPQVRIWDLEADTPLAVNKRPSGNRRVQQAFKQWGEDTVYRPWDRQTAAHSPHSVKPASRWHATRRLSFIMEDLYAHLNLNARAHRAKTAGKDPV